MTTITTNTKLLMNDGIMAIVTATKGRWVKIQRSDRVEGDIANISFADAATAAESYNDWYLSITEVPATEAEVEEMMESTPSMLSTLINFKGEETPKVTKKAEFDGHTCPNCGSTELWQGTSKGGLVQDNNVIGCHHCDWEIGRITRKNGIVKAEYLQGYQKVTVERNGQKLRTFNNGDAIAQMLQDKDLEQSYATVAEAVGIEEDVLRTRYQHLNNGQQKMCLSNLLRGFFKKQAQQ